uniref:Uncharacterized protein n=1 Tax=Rhodocyclus tenuis TaxID=1066 RepID=A0A840G6C5_RHOTE|nr:hypothetical protein [Rhodocyclus tenuis]MBB4247436.1 hypothetical protein [Rhodocyclus tenuis]
MRRLVVASGSHYKNAFLAVNRFPGRLPDQYPGWIKALPVFPGEYSGLTAQQLTCLHQCQAEEIRPAPARWPDRIGVIGRQADSPRGLERSCLGEDVLSGAIEIASQQRILLELGDRRANGDFVALPLPDSLLEVGDPATEDLRNCRVRIIDDAGDECVSPKRSAFCAMRKCSAVA